MRRWSVRSTILTALACAALLVVGVGAASAYEGTSGGWYWQNPLAQGNSLNDAAVTAAGAIAVGDAGVVFTSADGGASWTRRSSGRRGSLRVVDFVNVSTGWAAGDGGVIKTTNGGVSWQAQDLPGDGVYRFTDVSFVDASHGWACGSYAVAGGAAASRIVRTTDGGDTWTIAEQWIESASKAEVQLLMQVDFVNATTGWATGWGYTAALGDWGYVVLKTMDAGDTWSITRFGDGRAEISAMDFTTATDGWLATASLADYAPATIWRTTDGGGSWTAQTTRSGATITDLAASPAGECYVSGQTQGTSDWVGFVLHSSDDGATWTQEYAQKTVKPEAVAFASTTAIAVGDGALFLSRDATTGVWTQFAPGVRKNLTKVQFMDAKLGWAVGWKSTILRTTDGGRTWEPASVPSGISLEGIDMVTESVGWAVGCSGPQVPYADLGAGYGAVVLRTQDGGRHWKYRLNRTTSPGLAAVDFSDVNQGVAVGTNGVVVSTTDGGGTWWFRTIGTKTLRDVAFTDAMNGVAVGGQTEAVSGIGTIWMTSDGGVTWTDAKPEPAPSAPLRSILVDLAVGTLTVVGDNSQLYTGGGASWSYAAIAADEVVQDPPFSRFMDVGLCEIPATSQGLPDDANGWILGEDGAIWTRNGGAWRFPPTISSFAPVAAPVGTTVTLYGSGFTSVKPVTTTVTFQDANPVAATVISDAQLTAVVPAGAGLGKIAVTTSRGTGISVGRFTVTGAAPLKSVAEPASALREASAPTVAFFTPDSGPAGTSVTLTGSGFAGATEVAFNGVAAVFSVDGDLVIRATVPAGATTGSIAVTTPVGTGMSFAVFTVIPAPTITSFIPVSGPVGTSVTLIGANFTGATAVAFNGAAADFKVDSGTQITATVPPAASTGTISVTTPGGIGVSAASFTVLAPLPTITGFLPTSGPVGTVVTLSGSGFTGATAVAFNGAAAAAFTVVSDAQITATVPHGAATGAIAVTTPGGVATSATSFSVMAPAPTITSFLPTSGPAGTSVTLIGNGFIGATAVAFNGAAAVFMVDSATQITATVPLAATTGAITVTTPGGAATSATSFTVILAPVIESFTPTSGVVGTLVTLIGANFSGATAVTFNGAVAAFTVNNDLQITATVPAGATTGPISVTTPIGSCTSSASFTVTMGNHRLNHSGGSGQDNQLNSLAVVDWLNAWAVGDRGTILSFDRLAPDTTFAPTNGWLKTPLLSLTAGDGKSGVAWTRWIVDPPGINGDVEPPLGDWDSWPWQYCTTVTFNTVGEVPGTRHLIYYQSLDNVGNIELDPYWLKEGNYEVPLHVWMTVDSLGPQTYAPVPASVARGSRPAFIFWVNDDLSPKAKVTIVVKNARNETVKTLPLGWLATWQEFSAPISTWKCTLARGTYTFAVHAADQAGNSQAVLGSNTLTVR
jgi:photosystem II stability/assembly factor-like uncharacterized protein